MTKTIGMIGSGLVGKVVARLAVDAGFNVVLSNSRGPETISKFVGELGPLARAGTVDEAIAAGDIVIFSVPLASFEKVPGDKFAGKVVLDQSNYYPGMGGFNRADLDGGELTSSELVQRHLKGAKLVKGLHNLSWLHIEANARPKGDALRTTLPIAGDDAAAKETVSRFLDAIGYDVIDAGSLEDSWRVEPNTPIYFWRYAPTVAKDATGEEAKKIYQQPGKPVSYEEAGKLIAEAVRPSPIGGTLEGMPQVHIDLFMEQASPETISG